MGCVVIYHGSRVGDTMSTLPPILKLNIPCVGSHLLRESLGLYVKGSKFHVLGLWVPMLRSVGQGLCFVWWLGAVSWVFKGCLWWRWDWWVAVVFGGGRRRSGIFSQGRGRRRRSWVLHLLPMSFWKRILVVLACL